MGTGSFVSDEIVSNLIEKKLLKKKKYDNRIIFDGYPRSLSQAKNLDYLLKSINKK